ncbi:MAG: ATP-binding protein [Oscillospiraceae bacterium]|nr:ATP-binding protein [Oscillospiraceae bacterium]
MFVGNRNRINVSSSRFSDFIGNDNLYVDKTAFIEHVLQDASTVLLFTRPRRMGKSLNIDTLATFLDCKQNTAHLFSGLYVETSPVFNQVNQYPVVYLDFVNLDSSNLEALRRSFRGRILQLIEKLLDLDNLNLVMKEYINDPSDYSPYILSSLLEIVAKRCQKEPFLLIDEYDKIIMDTLNHPESDEIKNFIVNALQSALKGQTHFKKAVLTGVTRTTKESLFSTLNNLEVYDILHSSAYDADFSLTETELLELIPANEIDGVRKWYNNMRVGDELLYNIYSVMNYLSKPKSGLIGYWSMTGGGKLLSSLLNASRAEIIGQMLNDEQYRYDTKLDYQLNMEHIKNTSVCDDISFYTLAVQAGYLSFEQIDPDGFKVFIPNAEARNIWARLLLDAQYNGADNKLYNIFAGIDKVDVFSGQLTDFTSMVLSYNDFKEQAEWVYHVFFLGLVYSLGYECKSNLEAGLGRFDIYMKSRKFCAVIEFKASKSSDDDGLSRDADIALQQIDNKEYWHGLKNSPLPVYKIGIACHGKKCLVKTLAHKI